MNLMYQDQIAGLRQAASEFSTEHGIEILQMVEQKSYLLVNWLSYLNSYHRTGIADSLLDAFGASIRETAGVLSLGMVRQTLFSLRGQIDLVLAWLYFKDHEIEWLHINRTGDGFKLKKELFQYLDLYHQRFSHRYGILQQIATRQEADPYRLLSAHIHAQSDLVLPEISSLKDLVQSEAACKECALAVYEVAEFINDILLSLYLSNWPSLPENIKNQVMTRFKSAEQRGSFFS